MALAVTHSTAADGTFSATGSTAWDAAHTLTGTVATAQIADDAVTYAKIQDVTSTDRILGRSTAGAGVVEEITCTSFARSILDDADEATFKATVNLEIGTDVQAYSANLDEYAAVNPTAAGLALLDDASASDQRTTLGLAIGTNVQAQDAFLQNIADLADPNADRGLFWDDSAGALAFFTFGTGLTMTGTTLTSSGGASLDAITAAAGDQAGIANGDNNIRWNWAKTTNSEVAFEFGESAASTNGTSTSGVPNQVLLKLSTVAASTMSPLSVYSRATHVFSVSPTTAQIFATTGSVSAPPYGFSGSANTGMYFTASGTCISLAANGTEAVRFSNAKAMFRAGSVTAASITDINNQVDGLSWPGLAAVTMLIWNGSAAEENARWALGEYRLTRATANTTGYTINSRKARGTVASLAAVTTGDDLLTISASGYVGSTNTWQEAGSIVFDSTGTISDSTTGIGGILRFNLAKVGAEPAEIMRLEAGTTTGGGWAIMQESDANPTTTELASLDEFAIYMKANKLVIAYNNAATMTYISIPMDGSTTTWTHSTSAP